MNHAHFLPPSPKESSLQAHHQGFKANEDYKETPVDSPTTSLRTSREAPKSSLFRSSKGLRFLSLMLHSALVAIHLVLFAIWSKGTEHRVIFHLDRQKTVSFGITAITTGFGTIYLGLMVFVTQTLSTRRTIQTDQTLTAIHDSTAAWAGIGSAMFHLWHQTGVRGSIIGVLSAFGYLGGVLILHVTTPALFAVQTFTSSRLVVVGTQSLPSWNFDWSDETDITDYSAGSLYALPTVLGSNTSLGLYGGTLYDVLDKNAGVGNASVSATGFNISCKYPTSTNITYDATFGYYTLGAEGIPVFLYFQSTQWGVISALDQSGVGIKLRSQMANSATRPECFGCSVLRDPLILFSTIPIIDSSNSHPPMVDIASVEITSPSELNRKPPVNLSVPAVQILRCSQTLVPQTAVVDAQSNQILALEPDIQKTASTWESYTELDLELDNKTSGNMLLDGWAQWYLSMPPSNFPFSPWNLTTLDTPFVSIGAMYLIQKLNMHPSTFINDSLYADYSNFTEPANVTLHSLENALSILMASMFWTLGHVPPTSGGVDIGVGAWPYSTLLDADIPPPPILRGNGTVTEISIQGRLDLSIIAIVGGLSASVALTLLALPSLLPRKGAKDKDVPIDGTGILHTIWLYRNHPELDELLLQVEHPTTSSLREAGMVRTRLI